MSWTRTRAALGACHVRVTAERLRQVRRCRAFSPAGGGALRGRSQRDCVEGWTPAADRAAPRHDPGERDYVTVELVDAQGRPGRG